MWNQSIKFKNPNTCYSPSMSGTEQKEMNVEFAILPVNVSETENLYHYRFYVPGFSKDEIKIKEEGKTLLISAEPQEKDQMHRMLRKEFRKTKMKRMVRLAKDADVQTIQAKLEDGILEITVKKDETLNKSIQII
ncbi:MAG: Hsp20/alpha crystallin family protein [Saprospiraceae bacterium]|nr:Hsp20/alpha crystallin family protein [Saprospiraceae bacterium]MBK7810410.1 Hsp20/alpha crystallin family protein [Saprospiraceae bacterium]MBK9630006.1 Hsp20/alpha crystallin family protein [Saprospiraceae bacterium]